MKNTLPFLLLFICVIGCSKFGPNSSSTSNSNSSNAAATSTPAALKKVVDLPATLGKTKDEIKKMVSAAPKSEDPWLEYELPEASLTFMFDKGKANHSSLKFKSISFGGGSISGTETAEQLATMAGIDIKGKAPTSKTALGETYEQEIGGKKASITFYNTTGTYDSVIISPN